MLTAIMLQRLSASQYEGVSNWTPDTPTHYEREYPKFTVPAGAEPASATIARITATLGPPIQRDSAGVVTQSGNWSLGPSTAEWGGLPFNPATHYFDGNDFANIPDKNEEEEWVTGQQSLEAQFGTAGVNAGTETFQDYTTRTNGGANPTAASPTPGQTPDKAIVGAPGTTAPVPLIGGDVVQGSGLNVDRPGDGDPNARFLIDSAVVDGAGKVLQAAPATTAPQDSSAVSSTTTTTATSAPSMFRLNGTTILYAVCGLVIALAAWKAVRK